MNLPEMSVHQLVVFVRMGILNEQLDCEAELLRRFGDLQKQVEDLKRFINTGNPMKAVNKTKQERMK